MFKLQFIPPTILIFFLSSPSWASVNRFPAQSQIETETVKVAIIAIGNERETPANGPEAIELVVNPNEPVTFDEKDKTLSELLELSKQMESPEYQRILTQEIIIPVSHENEELVIALKNLPNEVFQKFLDFKGQHLRHVAKTLAFFRMRPERINFILNKFNLQFYENADFVANARSIVANPGVFVAAGVGLNDKALNYLRQYEKFKNLPDKSGFYAAFSFGISVVLTKKENGRSVFRIEPNVEIRIGKEFISPYLIGAVGATGTLTLEDRSASQLPSLKAHFLKASIPTFISGEDILGVSIPAGVNFVPGGGALAGIKGSLYRLQLTHELLPVIYRSAKKFVATTVNSCRKHFNKN